MPITLSDATSAAADWRNMPHVSGWWQFTSDAFLIAGAPDTTALFRRVCMWTIMVLRVLNGVVDFFSYLGSFSLLMAVLTPFLVLFDVVLISFCLAHIGQAEGSRRVFGFSVGRLHFDAFLVICAVSHVFLIFGRFFVLGWFTGPLLLLWWLLILGTAWVASREGDEGVTLV